MAGGGLTSIFERTCGEMWSVTPYALCDHRCVYVDPTAEIVFSPLAFGDGRDAMRLLGREYRRPDVWRAYDEEYRAFAHGPNTSWVRPSHPPQENHPLLRLPKPGDGVRVELSAAPRGR